MQYHWAGFGKVSATPSGGSGGKDGRTGQYGQIGGSEREGVLGRGSSPPNPATKQKGTREMNADVAYLLWLFQSNSLGVVILKGSSSFSWNYIRKATPIELRDTIFTNPLYSWTCSMFLFAAHLPNLPNPTRTHQHPHPSPSTTIDFRRGRIRRVWGGALGRISLCLVGAPSKGAL